MQVKMINLDGYEGWNVDKVRSIDVPSWTKSAVAKAYCEITEVDEDEYQELLDYYKGEIQQKGPVMTLMNEENGVVFVKMG